ncbi:MFS transporter [Henriciella aquimarina]|uniref:MFS transporter n=1 Tax=Henriciella aquimarina TaxID=545261 RepID=UPI0009FBEFC9|nr:MFS transporter [Henriciella aquimarina]
MTAPAMDTEMPLRPLSGLQKLTIALGSVALGAGMTVNFVVVAPLAREAGLSEVQVAGILTLSAAVYALMIPQWGRLADRFGRKRVMVFSLLAMAGTTALFVFALEAALAGLVTGLSTFFLLVFTRLIFGFLSPGLQPASMAALTDASTTETRAGNLGMLGAAVGLGSILGPAGASVLAELGALAPIWGSITFCVIAAVVIGFALPPSRGNRSTSRPEPLRMRDPRVLPHLVFLFSYFVAVGAIQQTLAWLIEDRYGLAKADSVQATGIAFACMSVALITVQFGYVQPFRPDPKRILPVGLLCIMTGYVSAAAFTPFPAVCIAFALVGTGSALAVPAANALGSLSVERHEQGSAAALLSAAPPSGFVFGPLLGATLYSVEHRLPLVISAAMMASLFAYRLYRNARGNEPG